MTRQDICQLPPARFPRAARNAPLVRRFLLNSSGSTAIEFAIVLGPFLLFVFGVFAIGLHYLATNSLERAVFSASRVIRTGSAQKSNMSVNEFKQMICTEAAPHIDCNKLQVHVQSEEDVADLNPVSCVNGGVLAGSGNGTDTIGSRAGNQDMFVFVTACYDWDAAASIPWFMKDRNGNLRGRALASGGMLMQASVLLRTEPYND